MFLMSRHGSDTTVDTSRTVSSTPTSIFLLCTSRGEPQVRPKQFHVEMLVALLHLVFLLISFVWIECRFSITQGKFRPTCVHTHTDTLHTALMYHCQYLKVPHTATAMIYSPVCALATRKSNSGRVENDS